MKTLSSLEIKAIVDELQSFIGAKVDQIYQPDSSELTISLYQRGIGRKLLRIIPGTALYLSTRKRVSPKHIINFCRFLRKRLNNARVLKIEQKNMERIVEFHFQAKEEIFILIAEFFSKGNIILCKEDYTVISAFQFQSWKDRKIRAKKEYVYPPVRQVKFNDFEEFAFFLEKNSKESIVKTLASGLNLGGLYAEEVCFRAQVDKTQETVDTREMKRLYTKLNEILEEKYLANIVNDIPVPFEMQSLGEGKRYASFNKALDIYYDQFMEDVEEEEVQNLTKKQKYEVILEEQKKKSIEIDQAIIDNKKKGDWIYANYIDMQEYLRLFKENKKGDLVKKGVRIEGTDIFIEIE